MPMCGWGVIVSFAVQAKNTVTIGEYRESRWDVVVGIICLILGVLGLKFASNAPTQEDLMQPAGESIGLVQRLRGSVRFRSQQSILWHDIATKERRIGKGDTIFTSDDGHANLRLDDGTSATLLSNSLVVIQHSSRRKGKAAAETDDHQDQTINVKQGSLKIDLQASTKNLEILAHGKTLRPSADAAGASLQVSVDPINKQAPLQITTSRPVTLSLGGADEQGKTLKLDAGQMAVVKADQSISIEAIPFKGVFPEQDARLVVTSDAGGARSARVPVKFEWKREQDIKTDGARLFLEIEGAEQMKTAVPIDETGRTLHLSGGRYSWRVTTFDAKSKPLGSSVWLSFDIVPLVPPQILSPAENSSAVAADGQRQKMTFLWKPLPSGMSAELEIKSDTGVHLEPKASEVEVSKTIELVTGQYRWRIRSVTSDGKESNWSEWRQFKIDSELYANYRNLTTSTETIHEEKTDDLDELPIKLQWDPVPGVNNYSVSVFDDEGNLVKQESVSKPKLIFKLSNSEKKYRFEVTSKLPTGRKIASHKTDIVFDLAAPRPKLPAIGSAHEASAEIYLTWKRIPLAQQYEVQVAKDKEFSSVMFDEKRQDNYLRIEHQDPGTYYWRVRAVSGDVKSGWGNTSSFQAQDTASGPVGN